MIRTHGEGRLYHGEEGARTAGALWRDGDVFVVKTTGASYVRTGGAWVQISVGTGTTEHNSLSNFDGGTTNEYYHLTAAQHTDLTDGGDTTLHAHDAYIANSLLTTRGDIITRNATIPERLALTVPASPVINFLGVVNGETQPSWKSASSAPGAAAAVLQTNASGVFTVVNGQSIGGYTLTMPETGTVVVRDAGAISENSIPYYGSAFGKLAGTTGMYWDNAGQQFSVGNSLHPSKFSVDNVIGLANALTEGFSVGRAGYSTIRGYINMASGYFNIIAHDAANNVGTIRMLTFNGTSDVERLRIATTGLLTATNGLTINEDGGSAATDDLRAESDTEANMLWLDASADLLYLGGSTNGVRVAKGGAVTLLGTAKYTRHIQIPAIGNGSVANQPTPVDFFTVGGLQFGNAAAKYSYLQFEMPDDWDGSDPYLEIDWAPDSGATGGNTVIWSIEYRSIAEGETLNNGTSVTLSVTESGSYSQYQTRHTRFTLPASTGNQPLAKQDHVFVKVTRTVADGFTGSVTVTGYEVIYTSTGFPTSN